MSTTKDRPSAATSLDLLAAAEAMLPEIRAAADDIDAARRLPGWLAERLADEGFFHLLTGREHGGMAADPVPPPGSSRRCPPPALRWAG